MREIVTDIEIGTPAEHVWEVLTDFARYPEWNPFIRSASGPLREGSRIEVRIEPPGSKGMTFRPVLLAVDAPRELRWLGHFGVRGIFDGEHAFVIEPLGSNRVRFVHRERFSGLLVPLLWRTLDTNTRQGFEVMNRAIKARTEAEANGHTPSRLP